MNDDTKNYRQSQLNDVLTTSDDLSIYTIQITGPGASTKHMNIDRAELLNITAILTQSNTEGEA